MEIYLVGGAVRDTLLGLPVKDRDWVIVGASPQQLVDQGYVPVGKDFPVFLHPVSKEEYALARTERNSAPGYKGFTVHAAPDVTLEQDLARRDLTINAIAVSQDQLDRDGNFDPATARLDDPFHGRRDLEQRWLRHVTDAFHDDPVRILRVARFAARFADFRVAGETMALMRSMVANGEADALVAERVWQELARGLMEDTPSRMLQELDACGALSHLLPELAGSGAGPAIAPGLIADTLDRAARTRAPLTVRFACLGFFALAEPALRRLCERLRAPNDGRDLALLTAREHEAVQRSGDLDPAALVGLLERCDAFRKPARFGELLQACRLLALPDPRFGGTERTRQTDLTRVLAAAQSVSTDTIARREMAAGRTGPQIGAAIHAARVEAVSAVDAN